MGTQCHTATYRGKWVHVVLKDGTEFTDQFLDRKSRKVIFKGRTVTKGSIRSFVPWGNNSPKVKKLITEV